MPNSMPTTALIPLSAASGFESIANPANKGANDKANCITPKNPFRLNGFSKNFIRPLAADPPRKLITPNAHLPI